MVNFKCASTRGYPLGGSTVQGDDAVAAQVAKSRRRLATQPAERVAALCAGAPEDGFIVRWSPTGVRQTEIGRLGVQPSQYAVVGDSQPPQGGRMVLIYVRRTVVFYCSKLSRNSDYCCDWRTTSANQKKNQNKSCNNFYASMFHL